MSLERDDADPILFDMGTGLRNLGAAWPKDRWFIGSALLSHLHWDHIQGLPFFEPILRGGSRLDIFGPTSEGIPIGEAFGQFLRPPFFPVTIPQLGGTITFHDVVPGTFTIGDAQVTAADVPHVGATLGYRVDVAGVSVAYVSDHQQPGIGDLTVAPAVVRLCQSADLLIHDAQYDEVAFAAKSTWGHCTAEYAVAVACAAEVKHLALFHHDPAHDDRRLDELLEEARVYVPAGSDLDVTLATEGGEIKLKPESDDVSESSVIN